MTTASADLMVKQILAAARTIVDRDGVQKLSMRTLAHELGSSTMATYHYVPNKHALLELLIDEVLAEIDDPDLSLPWESALRRYARSSCRVLSANPWVGPLLLQRQTIAFTRQQRHRDLTLELFHQAGFDDDNARLALGAFLAFMIGSQRVPASTRRDAPPSGNADGERQNRSEQLFEFSLAVLIAGLHAQLERVHPSNLGRT